MEDLPTKILKVAFLCTPEKLKRIFNQSLTTGVVPLAWKHATIIPLRKEGNSRDVNNLRPVSLLPLPGKILEKIIQAKLSYFLEEKNLLDTKQGGFRPNHSTTNTAVDFTEDIYCNMNRGEITAAVFVDLRKAFDIVNHEILLKKLKKMGINDFLLSWLRNYLTNRSQSTQVNNLKSEAQNLSCGVPQGSVLGPTLFLVYINDMSRAVMNVNHMLYADDTVLYLGGKDLDIVKVDLQNNLDKFCMWLKQNQLTLNVKKTKYVIYGSAQRLKNTRSLTLMMNGNQLEREHVYKYLGIYLDSTLNFNKHIDYVNKIVTHKTFLLSKIRGFIDQSTALHIFKSMIVPIFDYGSIVYAGGSMNKLDKLKHTQNRGLKVCLGIQGRIPCVSYFYYPTIPVH